MFLTHPPHLSIGRQGRHLHEESPVLRRRHKDSIRNRSSIGLTDAYRHIRIDDEIVGDVFRVITEESWLVDDPLTTRTAQVGGEILRASLSPVIRVGTLLTSFSVHTRRVYSGHIHDCIRLGDPLDESREATSGLVVVFLRIFFEWLIPCVSPSLHAHYHIAGVLDMARSQRFSRMLHKVRDIKHLKRFDTCTKIVSSYDRLVSMYHEKF